MAAHGDDPADYDIGYKKPPAQHQFKPGKSGNPKGTKAPTKTVAEIFLEEANKLVTVKQGEKVEKITMHTAIIRGLLAKAAAQNPQAVKLYLDFLKSMPADHPVEGEELSAAQLAVL